MNRASADVSEIEKMGDLSLSEGREENSPATSTTSELAREAQESESSSESDLSKELLTLHWTESEQEAYYRSLEDKAFGKYSVVEPEGRYFGLGKEKKSFCYLLLDPRVTQDLPRRGIDLPVGERWRIFLEAVFYVGEGKRTTQSKTAPESSRRSRKSASEEELKIRRIRDIGKEGQGVVCLQVFSLVMKEEACTRAACMIEAFNASNKSHLINTQEGTYCGDAEAMSLDEKCSLGKYLLYKSMNIFMLSGEIQHQPGISPERHIIRN